MPDIGKIAAPDNTLAVADAGDTPRATPKVRVTTPVLTMLRKAAP
jgi:hypothetical protein